MKYLGISLGFNSSACLFDDRLIKCASEERFNREKNTKCFPINAINFCTEGVNDEIIVCISHYETITVDYLNSHCEDFKCYNVTWKQWIKKYLSKLRIKDIRRVEHHRAHAASCLAFYDYDEKSTFITCDGFGDGVSCRIYSNGLIDELPMAKSVGLMYQFTTGALGFTEHEHEGKITGLAASGEPKYVEDFKKIYNNVKPKKLTEPSNIIDFEYFLGMKEAVYEFVKSCDEMKDVAASIQAFAEDTILDWIKQFDLSGVCYLSGGLFANVKLNQRIKDSGIFSGVRVSPCMGDEGTCIGACIVESKIYKNGFNNVFGGNDLGKISKIKFIAEKLAEKKTVCLVTGKMEFGPRALCHRTILSDCTDAKINDVINNKLGRTEFMPFAPVTIDEFAKDLFLNFDAGKNAAKYMTMTFDCSDEFIKDYPGVCHVDNTARPQVVSASEMPDIYDLIRTYYDLTGNKCLINTSYNLHGEPIILSKENAIESFRKSGLDYLVIGDEIYEN